MDMDMHWHPSTVVVSGGRVGLCQLRCSGLGRGLVVSLPRGIGREKSVGSGSETYAGSPTLFLDTLCKPSDLCCHFRSDVSSPIGLQWLTLG